MNLLLLADMAAAGRGDEVAVQAGGESLTLFVEGRSGDIIIRGGENIAPAEIGEALLGHPDVAECAFVGLPHTETGKLLRRVVLAELQAGLGSSD